MCVSVSQVSTRVCFCVRVSCLLQFSPFVLFNPSLSCRFLREPVFCAVSSVAVVFVCLTIAHRDLFSSVCVWLSIISPSLKNRKTKQNQQLCRDKRVKYSIHFVKHQSDLKRKTSKKFVVKCVLLICLR